MSEIETLKELVKTLKEDRAVMGRLVDTLTKRLEWIEVIPNWARPHYAIDAANAAAEVMRESYTGKFSDVYDRVLREVRKDIAP